MTSVLQNVINTNLDKSKMMEAITNFPSQIEKSFKIMNNWSPMNEYSGIHKIMIIGMGGSAIGGDVARVLVQHHCLIPIIVNRSYTIPKWVDSHTLILASSYSGETEETLNAFSQCREQKCPIVVLSTGGELTQNADNIGLDKVTLPKGYQPRAALGFSFTIILLILEKLGYIHPTVSKDVMNSISSLQKLCSELLKQDNTALEIAKNIHSTCPIIYGSEDLTWVVALRFRGQLAENAKMLSFHNHFPEHNHNEIEGWTINDDIMKRLSIIWLRDEEDHPRIMKRMDISSSLLKSIPRIQLRISQSGANRTERLLKLIHYTDWISYYAALLNNVDPTPVNRIQELKVRIGKID